MAHSIEVESSTVSRDPPVHTRIPSISLQRNSSQSSLEGEEEEGGRNTRERRFRKSRSVESSLSKQMANGSDTDLHGIMAPLNQLSISQSIHSLDSDSVFSIDDREDEEEDEEEEEEEGDMRQEDDSMLGFALELELSDMNSQPVDSFSQSLPLAALTPRPQDDAPPDKDSHEEEGGISSASLEQGHSENPQLHVVRRSKSVGSATAKWRRKKPSALAPPSSMTSHGITDPYELLRLFQGLSRECYPSSVCKVDFKTLLSNYSHNSETRNYELSFEREP